MLQEDDGLTFAAVRGRSLSNHLYRRTGRHSADSQSRGERRRLTANSCGSAFLLVLHGEAPDAATWTIVMITGTNGRFEIANTGTGFTFACTVTG